ncbi:MAG: septation protein A [Candidatus Sedimenticola endophacoides]|uniref:Inner membrane-spanning protein YciB n=1 Tax=Candidatus Sedimenticola endophacoides TaxID=2548426 RepID=A0A657PZ20_9GAMM|nr:MAG: septation protein A [Candidatus Sedimenticola endophacoides]OQX36800.1 MAG: septation protein A [Candidatus Sedimenticola endophacoides]OQX39595.1 MAG: septation protein A [Candidatus Sedimenticola endophacoides]OQX43145.1 MAG: septation protein A [Candidatus Sedimenticola endophacoides]OQX47549.1 MAG: septation protein A [Candidatus Sedimenticola endophacoides]
MKFLNDFLPVILFFIAYKLGDIYIATGVLIIASIAQVAIQRLLHKRVEKMHLVVLGLAVFFGGMTLLLHDPLFIKWKPTVVNWLFAIAFLGSRFIGAKTLVQRMMDHAVTLPNPVWDRLNTAWVIFFAAMGGLNLYVAFNFTEATWVDFKLFGMMGLTLVFVLIQAFYMSRFMPQPDENQGES